eukprot:Gb_12102 [translate_table: standard]
MEPQKKRSNDDESVKSLSSKKICRGFNNGRDEVMSDNFLQPAVQLVIKKLTDIPAPPPDYINNTYAKVKEAFDAIYSQLNPSLDLERVYQAVENLCQLGMGENLYELLEKENANYSEACLKSLCQENAPKDFLLRFENFWDVHCDKMKIISNIVLYLERYYFMREGYYLSVWEMGLDHIRMHFSGIANSFASGILALIEEERNKGKEAVDQRLLNKLFNEVLVPLNMNENLFVKPFLENTEKFYATKGREVLDKKGISDYAKYVQTRLEEETKLGSLYLNAKIHDAFIAIVKRSLIENLSSELKKGLEALLKSNKKEDIKCVYSILERVDEGHFWEGLLLNLRSSLHANCGSFSRDIQSILKDFFEAGLKETKCAEYLAKLVAAYIDETFQTVEDLQEVERRNDDALIMFMDISAQDVLKNLYRKDLAKRLLLQKTVSLEAEKAFTRKLISIFGSAYEFAGAMIEDALTKSQKLNQEFKKTPKAARLPGGFEMNVKILSSMEWPQFLDKKARIPQEIETYQNLFQDFYKAKYNNTRSIVWPNTLGTWVLQASFPAGDKEIVASSLECAVLMLFNDAKRLSFREIKEKTEIEHVSLLYDILKSLACGEEKLLLKEPQGENLSEEDYYIFNENFHSKNFRIEVNDIQFDRSLETVQTVKLTIYEMYKYKLDSVMVHLMKHNKEMMEEELYSRTKEAVPFPLTIRDFKFALFNLLDLYYMKSDWYNTYRKKQEEKKKEDEKKKMENKSKEEMVESNYEKSSDEKEEDPLNFLVSGNLLRYYIPQYNV